MVTRLYQEVLGRNPTTSEVVAWTDYIAVTGDLLGTARGFFDSTEYNATSRTLPQHVVVLYRTFLGRGPALAEVTPWVNYLVSFRAAVEDAFISSPEFQTHFASLFPQAAYNYESDVAGADRDTIEETIAITHAFFAAQGLGDPGRVTVHAYQTLEALIPVYVAVSGNPQSGAAATWASSTAVAGPGWIFIHAAAPSWRDSPPWGRGKIVAHEYFHVLQHAQGGLAISGGPLDQIPPGGPRWLLEGAAEWVGWRAISDAGLYDFEAAFENSLAAARSTVVGLDTMATTDGFNAVNNASYPLAFIDVDFLLRNAPSGPRSLSDFWRGVGQGVPWPAAFRAAFGRPIETFYGEFSAYRSALPVGSRVSGRVTRTGGAAFASIFVYACPTVPAGVCRGTTTGIDGTYVIVLDDGTYVVSFGRAADGARPDGYYSASGFQAGFTSATPITVTSAGRDGIDVDLPF